MDPWVAGAAEEIAGRAERELEALVGVSSPSGAYSVTGIGLSPVLTTKEIFFSSNATSSMTAFSNLATGVDSTRPLPLPARTSILTRNMA